jgi:hypothetical protein
VAIPAAHGTTVQSSGHELRSSARPLQQLPSVFAELIGRPDVPVEGLPGDTELAA